MVRVRALDVSSHSGVLSASQWEDARREGWELAVVQLWGGLPYDTMGPNPHAHQQLAAARLAGLRVAGYIWIPPDTTLDTGEVIRVAREAAAEQWEALEFVALDIEDPRRRRLHPTAPELRLQDAINHLPHVNVVIYTSRSMWPPIMADSLEFGGYPLWDADYGRGEDLDATFIPYGGWTQRAMLQYRGTTTVAGISVDLNVADLKRLGLQERPAPEPNPFPLGLALLVKRFAAVVAAFPLDQEEKDNPRREEEEIAAWQDLYDAEILPRRPWIGRG